MLTPEARDALAWLASHGPEHADRVAVVRAAIAAREDELRPNVIADRAAAAVARVATWEPVMLDLARAQAAALDAAADARRAAVDEARARAAEARRHGDRGWRALTSVGEACRDVGGWLGARLGYAVTLLAGALVAWLASQIGVDLPDLTPPDPPAPQQEP